MSENRNFADKLKKYNKLQNIKSDLAKAFGIGAIAIASVNPAMANTGNSGSSDKDDIKETHIENFSSFDFQKEFDGKYDKEITMSKNSKQVIHDNKTSEVFNTDISIAYNLENGYKLHKTSNESYDNGKHSYENDMFLIDKEGNQYNLPNRFEKLLGKTNIQEIDNAQYIAASNSEARKNAKIERKTKRKVGRSDEIPDEIKGALNNFIEDHTKLYPEGAPSKILPDAFVYSEQEIHRMSQMSTSSSKKQDLNFAAEYAKMQSKLER